MSFKRIMNREFEVAFSKKSQPVWFRIVKYIVVVCLIYFLWGTLLLWILLSALFILGLVLHLWYRYKTEGWTKSYGMWRYDKDDNGGER